ncbi:MAG: hypothetical protein COA49_04775 [Bacteroidetes bacterium]|nr:MAG: hypothetical protein COA49_04775 [Bacteroidota bacterium]
MSDLNLSDPNANPQSRMPQGDTIVLGYNGVFKPATADFLLSWLERLNNENSSLSRIDSKRLFRATVELVQNLIHHSKSTKSTFFVSKSSDSSVYTLMSSNPVSTSQASHLASALNSIKETKDEELRGFKKNVLENESRSSHGGGGMGLLDLTLVSNGNISYEFLPCSEDLLLFSLTVKIHSIPS